MSPTSNRNATPEHSLRAVRWAHGLVRSPNDHCCKSITSYLVIVHPNVRIIPIALGIFGYTIGSLLGVFLCGIFTNAAATISATSSQ